MLGYTMRRLLLAVFVLWGVATVVFVIVRMVPADPALLIAGDSATPEQLAALRKEMGLDLPLIVQYLHVIFVGTTAMATALLPIILAMAESARISPIALALP